MIWDWGGVRRVLNRFPRLRDSLKAVHKHLFANQVSSDYRLIEANAGSPLVDALAGAWKDSAIPLRQREVVDRQLMAYREGAPNEVFDALISVLVGNIPDLDKSTILEIGCSSGYYAEVLAAKGIKAAYRGCDYSESFVASARRFYPGVPFDVQDAVDLGYADGAFDIVISGGCILHIPHYGKAVGEAARVAKKYVVFHRTPVLHRRPTQTYTKKAYGVDSIEIHFNEQALIRLFADHGLAVIDVNTHAFSCEPRQEDALAMKTYLCIKSPRHV